THTATALVLFLFFWKDWKRIISGFIRSAKTKKVRDTDEHLAWLLIIATIPAGLLGLIFAKHLQSLFASPQLVAIILILNGLLLWGAEQINKRNVKTQQTSTKSDQRITRKKEKELMQLLYVWRLRM
ncbi:MAG: undecaprenyl-diphosphate phosphatase, partial [Rhabdochlamydiaceae bacterium]